MGNAENKLVSRRIIEDLFNNHRYEVLDELLAATWVVHAFGGTQDRARFEEMVRANQTAFPDYHCVVDDQIAEDDRVATRWTVHATRTGDFQGIPPTSHQVSFTGIAIDRIVDGKLLESWLETDGTALLQQLGVAPAPTRS